MNTKTCTKADAVIEVNGVLVDVIDHGEVETPWGDLPRISLGFETDIKDESGTPRILFRTFNNYRYPKSALTLSVKNWFGIDLSFDDSTDLQEYIGKPATLGCEKRVSQSGYTYLNVKEINPPGEVHLQPSGMYEREVEI